MGESSPTVLKIEKIDNDKQKIILTGLIVSDEFCKQIIPILSRNNSVINEIFSSFSKTICGWCTSYYLEYKKAPKKMIQEIFENRKEKGDWEEDWEGEEISSI